MSCLTPPNLIVWTEGLLADEEDSNGMVEALILFESIVNSQCEPFSFSCIAHSAV